MAKSRPVYSEGHDSSLHPRASKRGKKRQAAPSSPKPVSFIPPQVSFLPKNLSEQQRIDLRARQLLAGRREAVPENLPVPGASPEDALSGPLEDYDLKTDLDVRDPRGRPYYNQTDGESPFPLQNGPQPTHTKTRTLGEQDLHPPLPDFDAPHVHASSDLIAAVPADDQMILAFDNELTVMHTTLRRLRQKAQRMAQAVARQDDNPGDPHSPTSHAKNVVQMIATILEPWFSALDDEFGQLLKGTEQGEALEEEGEV